MDHHPQAPLSRGLFQARIWEWVAFSSPGRSSNPGIEPGFCIAGGFFTNVSPGKTHDFDDRHQPGSWPSGPLGGTQESRCQREGRAHPLVSSRGLPGGLPSTATASPSGSLLHPDLQGLQRATDFLLLVQSLSHIQPLHPQTTAHQPLSSSSPSEFAQSHVH